jgi:heat-inducible transcriptional repressor
MDPRAQCRRLPECTTTPHCWRVWPSSTRQRYGATVDKVTEPLNDRERSILQALVEAHAAHGEPVGSKMILGQSSLPVSSATVRNVMAALEERGFLAQPHASAGRVPTDLGLRYYVDSLVQFTPPPPELAGEIERSTDPSHGVNHALREASRVLSRLAQHTSIVLVPASAEDVVAHVELVRLRDDAVLFIWVSQEGRVHNRLLSWMHPPAPPAHELDRVSRQLTDTLRGHALTKGRMLLLRLREEAAAKLQQEEARIIGLSHAGLTSPTEHAVHVEGTAHLVPHDGVGSGRLRELLQLLSESERLAFVFDEVLRAPGMRVFIGQENSNASLADHGVITAAVGADHHAQPLGVVAVLGPRNLDYRRVVPLVDATAQLLTRMFT